MNEISEMIDGVFSYEKKTCRALVATYHKCILKRNLGNQKQGLPLDEIIIDYNVGLMQLSSEHRILEEFIVDLIINQEKPTYTEETYKDEEISEAPDPSSYMDAGLALSMIDNMVNVGNISKKDFGVPNLSHTFGQYVEENREKDGLSSGKESK